MLLGKSVSVSLFGLDEMMKHPFFSSFLACSLALCACGGSSESTPSPKACGGSEPEGDCTAITECVWTGDTSSACLQICESTEVDCTENEECRQRMLRSSDGWFRTTWVCVPKVEAAKTSEAQAARDALCAERSAESCARSPLCDAQIAMQLVVEDQCRTFAATDCFPHYGIDADPEGRICSAIPSLATHEDWPGSLFLLGSCSRPGFEPVYPEADDPLYDLIYGEAPATGWSFCY